MTMDLHWRCFRNNYWTSGLFSYFSLRRGNAGRKGGATGGERGWGWVEGNGWAHFCCLFLLSCHFSFSMKICIREQSVWTFNTHELL